MEQMHQDFNDDREWLAQQLQQLSGKYEYVCTSLMVARQLQYQQDLAVAR